MMVQLMKRYRHSPSPTMHKTTFRHKLADFCIVLAHLVLNNTIPKGCKHILISHTLLPDIYTSRNNYTHLLGPRLPNYKAYQTFRGLPLILLVCSDTGALVNPGPHSPKYPC